MKTVKLLSTMSLEKTLALTSLKFDSIQFTGLERWSKIDADQSLLGSFVGRTETAFGLKEARLKNPPPTLMHIPRKTTLKLFKRAKILEVKHVPFK